MDKRKFFRVIVAIALPAASAWPGLNLFAQDEGGAAPAAPVKPRPSEIMPLAAKSLLLDVVKTDGRLVAVGWRGDIVASADGKEWTQVQAPVRAALTAVFFVDPNNGWAVGHDAVILHTADGGKTWALQNFQPELESPFLDVYFLDANRGFALGGYGLFYKTEDAGVTWTKVDAPAILADQLHLNRMIRLHNGDLFIAGEQGLLGVSSDQGKTWQKVPAPYENSLFGALPFGDKGAVIYGLRGHVFVTGDVRANQWREVNTGTVATMFGGAVLSDGRFLMVGLNGTILTLDPSGGNPKLASSPVGKTLAEVIPLDGQLLAVGEAGAETLPTP